MLGLEEVGWVVVARVDDGSFAQQRQSAPSDEISLWRLHAAREEVGLAAATLKLNIIPLS
jgi:hypothetical protein